MITAGISLYKILRKTNVVKNMKDALVEKSGFSSLSLSPISPISIISSNAKIIMIKHSVNPLDSNFRIESSLKGSSDEFFIEPRIAEKVKHAIGLSNNPNPTNILDLFNKSNPDRMLKMDQLYCYLDYLLNEKPQVMKKDGKFSLADDKTIYTARILLAANIIEKCETIHDLMKDLCLTFYKLEKTLSQSTNTEVEVIIRLPKMMKENVWINLQTDFTEKKDYKPTSKKYVFNIDDHMNYGEVIFCNINKTDLERDKDFSALVKNLTQYLLKKVAEKISLVIQKMDEGKSIGDLFTQEKKSIYEGKLRVTDIEGMTENHPLNFFTL